MLAETVGASTAAPAFSRSSAMWPSSRRNRFRVRGSRTSRGTASPARAQARRRRCLPAASSTRGCGAYMSIQRAFRPPARSTRGGRRPGRRRRHPAEAVGPAVERENGEPSSTKKLSSKECRCSSIATGLERAQPDGHVHGPRGRVHERAAGEAVARTWVPGLQADLVGAQNVVHCSVRTYNTGRHRSSAAGHCCRPRLACLMLLNLILLSAHS